MNVSHVSIPFEKLEEILCLPDAVRIVAAKEHENGRFVVFRVIADRMPQDFVLEAGDSLSKIGDAYRETVTSEPAIEDAEILDGELEETGVQEGPVS